MIHFNWGDLVLTKDSHLFSSAVCFTGLFFLIFFGRRALKKARDLNPSRKISIKGILEAFIIFIIGMSNSVVGDRGRSMIPVFATIFLMIWLQNVLGLVPGFTPSTDNLNATLALGICAFAIYNYHGIRTHGFWYIKQFLGPVIWIAPFMLVLEIITHLMRPVSLALRLYGNMMGDHAVLGSFLELAPYGVPVIFYFLGLFVCTIQAFVFTMLSMIYYSMAISHDH